MNYQSNSSKNGPLQKLKSSQNAKLITQPNIGLDIAQSSSRNVKAKQGAYNMTKESSDKLMKHTQEYLSPYQSKLQVAEFEDQTPNWLSEDKVSSKDN